MHIRSLDEAPEFAPHVLEALRTPMESGYVSISRSNTIIRYPAQFQLILAANPCPCGMAGTPGSRCHCPSQSIRRYNTRLSGPILDRIDIHQRLNSVTRAMVRADTSAESSAQVAERVAEARLRGQRRWQGSGWCRNAEVPGHIARAGLSDDCLSIVEKDVLQGQMSARGVDKVARLSWTLADLAGRDKIETDDVVLAMALHHCEWMVAV